MKEFLRAIRPALRTSRAVDCAVLLSALAYCGLAPRALELTVRNGVFAYFGLMAAAFCQALPLLRHRTVFAFAARMPFRYERFLLAFLSLFTAPLAMGLCLGVAALWGLDAAGAISAAGEGFGLRCLQALFSAALLKILAIHLLLILQRGIAWMAGYFTLQIAMLLPLNMLQVGLGYPDAGFAVLFLAVQVLLVVYAVRKGFHRVLY